MKEIVRGSPPKQCVQSPDDLNYADWNEIGGCKFLYMKGRERVMGEHTRIPRGRGGKVVCFPVILRFFVSIVVMQ